MNGESIVRAYVEGASKPAAITLEEDIHVFHFDAAGDYRNSPLLFVNRNGNHFRVANINGAWILLKTWTGMFEASKSWMKPGLTRPDALQLIKLCGVGPQTQSAAFESLCLLPREATVGRRKAAWRGDLMDVSFDRDDDSFTLWPERVAAKRFSGKLWESQEAAEWCKVNLSGARVVTASVEPLTSIKAPAPAEVEMAMAELWGSF